MDCLKTNSDPEKIKQHHRRKGYWHRQNSPYDLDTVLNICCNTFVGYVLMQIPSNIPPLSKIRSSLYIPAVMAIWG
jgi:hypothetical protein